MEKNNDVQVGTETEKHVDKLTNVCPRKKSHIGLFIFVFSLTPCWGHYLHGLVLQSMSYILSY